MTELSERVKALAVEARILPGVIGQNGSLIQWWHMEAFAQAVARECLHIACAEHESDSTINVHRAITERFGLEG